MSQLNSRPDAAITKTPATRVKYFSGEDARKLIKGEVEKVVITNDIAICHSGYEFCAVHCGEVSSCYVPDTYIKNEQYNDIAEFIRGSEIIYYTDTNYGNVVEVDKLDADIVMKLLKGEVEKIAITALERIYENQFASLDIAEIFYDKGEFVMRTLNNKEYELVDWEPINTSEVYGDAFISMILNSIHKSMLEIFSFSPAIDMNDMYMSLAEYSRRAWMHNNYNFEVIDTDGNTWYWCNKDENYNTLPVMEWYVGKKHSDFRVAVGDVRVTYYDLVEKGDAIKSMVSSLVIDVLEAEFNNL